MTYLILLGPDLDRVRARSFCPIRSWTLSTMRRKGERTVNHRKAQYPHAVDIPILGSGWWQDLNRIIEAAEALPASGKQWGHQTRGSKGDPQYRCRVGTKRPEDADAIARQFEALGARRVR